MSKWNSGYVADIDYTYGYFRELSPALLSLVLLNRGIEGSGATSPRYLELGFGQGVSLAIHAATCEGEFWGTDFHPAHAAHAQALVAETRGDARVFDQSFAEFAARDDLPEFDIITLHGIWSWIAPEQRACLTDLVRRKLAPGGILYVSYNAMPGCAPLLPMQHLMMLHGRLAGAPGSDMPKQVGDALAFTRAVIASGAHYFQLNPIVAARFDALATRDPCYLAHEFFGEHWQPMAFADVQRQLDDAKLTFVGSTALTDHIDALHLQPEGLEFLRQIGNPVLRESVRDMLVNAQFRTDVFVRGPRTMSDAHRRAGYLTTRFILTTPPQQVPMTLKTIAGELVFDQTVYGPLLAALADDNHAVKSLATLRTWPGLEEKSLESLIQAIVVLNGEGHVHPAQSEEKVDCMRVGSAMLTDALLRRACYQYKIGYLPSPVTGAGFPVSRMEQLFLLAKRGAMPAAQWPAFACATILSTGDVIHRFGHPLTDAKEGLVETTRQAELFMSQRLPILQALGIA